MTLPRIRLTLGNPWVRYGAIALAAVIVLTLLLAPHTPRGAGSTYSRAPDGYGAWYAYMEQQGTPIQRWRKPFSALPSQADAPSTLVRVNRVPLPPNIGISDEERAWVVAGNRLIVLGIAADVTAAPFTTTQATDAGLVRVETRRRFAPKPPEAPVLADDYGAIALRAPVGQGEIVYIGPYYLAANAYQNEPGNFAFLAQVVAQDGNTLYIDEFIHGYTDREEGDSTGSAADQSVLTYLGNTPLVLLAIQASLVLLLLIVAENQRFGLAIAPRPVQPNNSRAYIDALATVLHKAESSEFVVEMVGKQEQLALQLALGLGSTPLPAAELLQAWSQHTGRAAAELEQVFRPYWQHQRLSEADLITWIARLKALHTHLPERRSLP